MKISVKEDLDRFISANWEEINWKINDMQKGMPLALYNSVDIREGAQKYAPIDNNIYPAGFNNICLQDLNQTGKHFKRYFEKLSLKEIERIAIVPESHTTNSYYLDHLAMLKKCLKDAGYQAHFISFDVELFADNSENPPPLQLISNSGFDIEIRKAQISEKRIICDEETINLVILNNDQSRPIDIDWKKIDSIVVPPPEVGWFRRHKTEHFSMYQKVADEFCSYFDIDPDLIQAKFSNVDSIDFSLKSGLEELASKTDDLLNDLPENAKVFIKASQGTYGMGISVVSAGSDIINMNRKKRNKMDVGKNRIKFNSVLLQEAIETVVTYDDMPAEVTIYLVDGHSVGGFMRANSEKDANSNLNSKGMVFQKFCISEIRQNKDLKKKEAVYSTIARLSAIASGLEIAAKC